MDANEVRRFMASWPTGITVVTASGRRGRPLGKAANSFHTVSMAPPLVAWCVDLASTRYDEWMAADAYGVHVLGASQRVLVEQFAAKGSDKFGRTAFVRGPYDVPMLPHCHLRLLARVVDRHRAGDHCYLIGEVFDLRPGDESAPLIFYGGTVSALSRPALCKEG